jgi:hypothetical protein
VINPIYNQLIEHVHAAVKGLKAYIYILIYTSRCLHISQIIHKRGCIQDKMANDYYLVTDHIYLHKIYCDQDFAF